MYKVYIVEDDPMVSSINERFINKFDKFKVVGSSLSGKGLAENIDLLKPDLLLLDIYMPGINGIELLKEIRKNNKRLEVIMVTAAQDVDTITEALSLGVMDYLIKPYDFSRLKKALENFIIKVDLIKDSKILTQKDLDKINNLGYIHPIGESSDQEMPKGLDELTLNKIQNIINLAERPLSSSEVGEILSVSRITARKYLEYLAESNLIQIHLKYGNTGRPTRLYQRIK
jgi:response regulator of citrate/malate metabolism